MAPTPGDQHSEARHQFCLEWILDDLGMPWVVSAAKGTFPVNGELSRSTALHPKYCPFAARGSASNKLANITD